MALGLAPSTEPQKQARAEFESYLVGSGDSLDLELAFTGLESIYGGRASDVQGPNGRPGSWVRKQELYSHLRHTSGKCASPITCLCSGFGICDFSPPTLEQWW